MTRFSLVRPSPWPLLMTLALVIPRPLTAQDPAPETPAAPSAAPLTLKTALEQARQNAEDFALNQLSLRRAEAARAQAFAALLPKVTLQGLYTHNSYEVVSSTGVTVLPYDNVTGTGSLTAPLFAGSALPAYTASKANEKASQASLEQKQTLLTYQVAQLYVAAVSAEDQLTIREQALGSARESLRVALERNRAGVALPTAVSRAELEVARALTALEISRSSLSQARLALGFWLGRPVPEPLERPSLIPPRKGGIQERDVNRAREDVVAAGWAVEAARAALEGSWMAWVPTLTLVGSFRATPYPGYIGGGVPADPFTWQAGLRLDFTLYDGGLRRIDRQLKEVALTESRLQEQRLKRQVSLEVEQARLQLASAEAQLLASRQAVSAARAQHDLVSVQEKLGRATPLEVADALTAQTEAEVQLLQSNLARELAWLSLRRALGLSVL